MQFGSRPSDNASLYSGKVSPHCEIRESMRFSLDGCVDINSAGSHLLDLINNILDISKVESGKAELLEDQFEVAKAVESCLNLVRQRAYEGEVEIKVPRIPPMRR